MKNEPMEINMKLLKSVIIAASFLLASFSVSASIESDIVDNQPINVIINNALADNISLEDIFEQIAANNASLIPAAVNYASANNLASITAILDSAFKATASLPDLAAPIANAARQNGATEADILNVALANNIDPTTLGEATAAGGGTPGGTGSPIAPPSFASAGGSGGGGTASAN